MTILKVKNTYKINREAAITSASSYGKIEKQEHLTGEEMLPSDQSRIIARAKFTIPPVESIRKANKND